MIVGGVAAATVVAVALGVLVHQVQKRKRKQSPLGQRQTGSSGVVTMLGMGLLGALLLGVAVLTRSSTADAPRSEQKDPAQSGPDTKITPPPSPPRRPPRPAQENATIQTSQSPPPPPPPAQGTAVTQTSDHEAATLRGERNKALVNVKKLEGELRSARENAEARAEAAKTANKRAAALTAEIAELVTEAKIATETVSELKDRLDVETNQRTLLEQQLSERETELVKARTELDNAKSNSNGIRADKANAEKAQNNAQTKVTGLNEQVKALEKQLDEKAERVEALEKQLFTAQKELANSQAAKAALNAKASDLKRKQNAALLAKQNAETAVKQLQADINKAQKTTEEQGEAAKAAMKQVTEAKNDLDAQIAELIRKLKGAETIRNQALKTKEELQAQLAKSEKALSWRQYELDAARNVARGYAQAKSDSNGGKAKAENELKVAQNAQQALQALLSEQVKQVNALQLQFTTAEKKVAALNATVSDLEHDKIQTLRAKQQAEAELNELNRQDNEQTFIRAYHAQVEEQLNGFYNAGEDISESETAELQVARATVTASQTQVSESNEALQEPSINAEQQFNNARSVFSSTPSTGSLIQSNSSPISVSEWPALTQPLSGTEKKLLNTLKNGQPLSGDQERQVEALVKTSTPQECEASQHRKSDRPYSQRARECLRKVNFKQVVLSLLALSTGYSHLLQSGTEAHASGDAFSHHLTPYAASHTPPAVPNLMALLGGRPVPEAWVKTNNSEKNPIAAPPASPPGVSASNESASDAAKPKWAEVSDRPGSIGNPRTGAPAHGAVVTGATGNNALSIDEDEGAGGELTVQLAEDKERVKNNDAATLRSDSEEEEEPTPPTSTPISGRSPGTATSPARRPPRGIHERQERSPADRFQYFPFSQGHRSR